jgi:hypothetical protein
MAHFAKLDLNNRVITVLAGKDGDLEEDLCAQTGEIYKQTSYNTRGGVYYTPGTSNVDPDQSKAFRKNYACIGGYYDETLDAFIPPKFYESWVLDSETCLWKSSIPKPDDGYEYVWNETLLQWVRLPG